MFLVIYNIYVDSIIFIRKNIFVLLPYIFYEVLIFTLRVWPSSNSFFDRPVRSYLPMLIVCFLEMFIVLIVYKKEAIIVSKETIWELFNRFFGSTLLLIVYSGFIAFLCVFVLMFLFMNMPVLRIWIIIFFAYIIAATYPLSLRHLIYHNNIMVVDSIKAGMKELFRNFFFYLFVVLLGMAVLIFPSLIMPSSWFTFPILPIAEFAGSGSGIDWFRLLLNPILSTLTSVALTYAFIFKNKKNKHVS